jgi:cell division protein FtsW
MKMGFVPEAGNDFVFAVIGEELGLLGGCVVVALFGLIAWVGWRLVLTIEDRFCRYLVLGFTAAICMQAALNLYVVTGLAPAKGIDLPFLSSGGTNLAFALAGVGIIGNAARTGAAARIPHPRRD